MVHPSNGFRLQLLRQKLRLLVSAIALSLLGFHGQAAASEPCALSLVVAVDVSASVDEIEYDLQLNGLASALKDEKVVDAIKTVGGIWISGFEWSGRYQQKSLLGWRFLSDEASIAAAAADLSRNNRDSREFLTALGHALAHASTILKAAPDKCIRQVIDVSSDGINNEGFDPAIAYHDFDFLDVTVNALVVQKDEHTVGYFERKVIRGPGAFVEVAGSYQDYEQAMIRKLLREISAEQLAKVHVTPGLQSQTRHR